MSLFDPNYMSAEFASASHGYASVPAADLKDFLAKFPRAVSMREKSIVMAVEFGIRNPEVWENRRAAPRAIMRGGE
ncbi:MAG: hypothetical protein KGL39_05015 [Patescibacteria group bacterium]|nr:hypothetical protein [Patescibacteria group bacterium]